MNAEDCLIHRPQIDITVFYPWVCPCKGSDQYLFPSDWWDTAAADMDRIVASGENLTEEPDDWGYDDFGNLVDRRTNVVDEA